MKLRLTNRRWRRGFTLVEIIIVAALISLFSGLATFGIQQMLKNNKMKAVIGESRQVGQSLIFAHQDIGYYPKIGFLAYDNEIINNRYAWNRIHSMTLDITETKGLYTYNSWGGPYFAASQTRNQLSTRYNSNVTMRLYPYRDNGDDDINWPADQWGNPYVLYLFSYDAVNDDYQFIQRLGEEPNFWAAVVSYGPNGVPGTPTQGESIEDLRNRRLFHQDNHRVPLFRSLLPSEYNEQRREMYDRNAPNIGIIDEGSDDIIYQID